jgi:hypothetical protein
MQQYNTFFLLAIHYFDWFANWGEYYTDNYLNIAHGKLEDAKFVFHTQY